MEEKNIPVIVGSLIYDDARNCLILDGYELSQGENIEIHVFGSWIPGQVAIDSAGWYLVTLDQVGIRLQSGLLARSCEFRFSGTTNDGQPLYKDVIPAILIVDDDPALLSALPRTISLRIPHVKVETVSSAHEALELIQKQRFDTIISDIKMPGMDGLALLAKIQEQQPETPTILITGHGEHNLAIQALRGGAYDYIQKPIERDNFVAAVLRAIQTCQLRRQVQEQQSALELYTRSLERLVQQRTQELAEAHTTKDKVISLVSHEMKEPVARLKSVTQLLRQKLSNAALSEIVQQIFAEIETSIERTEHLVQELLETSDIETQRFIMHRQQRDLVQLCQKVLDEELPRINQRFVICEVQGPLYVEVDEEQIFQVLRLLIDSTQASSSDLDTAVTITLQQSSQEAILSLRDEGSRVGLGAGLYISRKIVERHGGHLEIQSFPENRRSIFVSLPLFQGSAAQSTQTVQTVFDEQQDEVIALVPQIMATWVIASSKNRVSLDS